MGFHCLQRTWQPSSENEAMSSFPVSKANFRRQTRKLKRMINCCRKKRRRESKRSRQFRTLPQNATVLVQGILSTDLKLVIKKKCWFLRARHAGQLNFPATIAKSLVCQEPLPFSFNCNFDFLESPFEKLFCCCQFDNEITIILLLLSLFLRF